MLGCRCGAKWSAAEYVDEAVVAGANLRTRAKVRRVLIEDGHAVGVEGTLGRAPFMARAEIVVLAAGGIGTPRILQASGFREAGQGMTMDTTVMVYGFVKERGIGNEPPMTWSWENNDAGYMFSTLMDPWLLYPLINSLKGLKYALTWLRWNHPLGVMIKSTDDISGGVFPDGRISKPLTANDRSELAQDSGRGWRRSIVDLHDAAARHTSQRYSAAGEDDRSEFADRNARPVCVRCQRLPRSARSTGGVDDHRPG